MMGKGLTSIRNNLTYETRLLAYLREKLLGYVVMARFMNENSMAAQLLDTC
jgi:hypothetical protein